MSIDVREPQSPGWWLQKLAKNLQAKQPRLQKLRERYEGDAPVPEGPQGEARKAYETFVKKARTNFAELVVEALRERLRVTGFRTAAAGDEDGDTEARKQWDANKGDIVQSDVTEFCLSMSEAYAIVGIDPATSQPVITAEDPRQVASIHDPVFDHARAVMKMFHDDDMDRDIACLYLPGALRVAYLDRKATRLGPRFSASTWNWDDARGGIDGEPFVVGGRRLDVVPAVRFRNRRGVAEFEPHIDILERIDHQVLQRMVIATMQAFRQRAAIGAPLKDPVTGEKIPYDQLLAADPGAVWLLPAFTDSEGQRQLVQMWESGQVDLNGILSAAEKDIGMLAAVTRTPLPMLMPGDGAESAEGASFKREGLVFKAEDRIARFTEGWKDVMSLAFLFAGDAERADRSQIEVLWASPERRSLNEMADADSKSQKTLPWAERAVRIYGYEPSDIPRLRTEMAADALAAASLAPVVEVPVVRRSEEDAA